MSGNITFGSEKSPIKIIDQFGGKRPTLFNLEFLDSIREHNENTRYDLKAIVTIILDSQIASYIHNYRIHAKMGWGIRKATEDLLLYVSEHRYDYNPTFYFFESFCKSTLQSYLDNVSPVATSILYFQSMDVPHFSKTREIKPDPDLLEEYLEKYNSSSLEECGRAWAAQISGRRETRYLSQMADATYACLLKMVLIHKKDKKDAIVKLEEFEDFILTELGFFMGRERLLAAYYFHNLIGAFIGVQENMKLSNAKSKLRATAWDIFLLRQPEALLTPSHLPEMNLAYVCTAEQELGKLGELFTIERLFARSDEEASLSPAVSMTYAGLEKKLGKRGLAKFLEESQERSSRRALRKRSKSLHPAKLRYVIDVLEAQLSHLCKPG